MPLIKGAGKKIVSENIREFHTCKTYAQTEARHGKKVADRQAVAVALSTAGRGLKSRRKQTSRKR